MNTFAQLQGFEIIGRQQIARADCLDAMARLPEKSVDLIFSDPPYNLQRINCDIHEWDCFESGDDYLAFMLQWIVAATRCAKDNATMLIWHSQMPYIARILVMMETLGEFDYASTLIWHKKDYNSQCAANSHNLSFYNKCEFLLHFTRRSYTGMNPVTAAKHARDAVAGADIIQHMQNELQRLGLTKQDFLAKYKEVYPDASGAMYSHWFTANQFALPPREVWKNVFEPLGFKALRADYDAMRADYDAMRPYFDNSIGVKGNLYESRMAYHADGTLFHPCQKPQQVLRDVIIKTCPKDGIILDPFGGCFSVACAAHATGRQSISVEKDYGYFETGRERLKLAQAQLTLDGFL